MTKTVALIFALSLLAACDRDITRRPANVISFVESDGAGHPRRSLAFELSNEPAKTCLAGTWKKARVVNDPSHYTKDSAYSLDNGRLEVLLINGLCDAYDSYIGKLSAGSFNGDHVAYGLGFSKGIGSVTGSYSGK